MTIFNHLNIIIPRVSILAVSVLTAMVAIVLFRFFMIPNIEISSSQIKNNIPVKSLYIEESSIPYDVNWSIFKSKVIKEPDDLTPIDELYILRGTFIVSQSNNTTIRKAIIDDLKNNTQLIVVEEQVLNDGRKILRIQNDQVILVNGIKKEIITIPFSISSSSSENLDGSEQDNFSDNLTGKFGGKKTGDNEWEFEKDKIMKYYEELMAEPKRLLNLFDSFAPVYDDNKRITGYKIDIKGEKEFINAVGLKNGDYITKVNALKLTNRRRAEYMIGEFIEGRASTFALEVEREGNQQKIIYRTY
jgi:type II secretory pathway component PulC